MISQKKMPLDNIRTEKQNAQVFAKKVISLIEAKMQEIISKVEKLELKRITEASENSNGHAKIRL